MHNSLKFLVMATAIVSATPAHAAPAPVTGKWITTEGGLRLRPDYWAEQGGMDGFYISLLRKAG